MLREKKYDFFLSYSRNIDLEVIEKLVFDLSEYNIEVWYDRKEIILGSDIYIDFEKLLNEIKFPKGCIVFFDKSYFSKEWCKKEISAILSNNLYMLPILYNINKNYLLEKDKRLMRYNYHTLKDLKKNNDTLINKILNVLIANSNICKIKILPEEIWNVLYQDFYTTPNNSSMKIIKADTICSYIKCKYQLTCEQLRLLNISKIKNQHFIKYGEGNIDDIKICIFILEKLLQFS